MATQRLISTGTQGHRPAAGRPLPLDTTAVHPDIGGSIDSVRGEINDAYADIKTFTNREPDEIMRIASGHSARLSELRVRIMRIDEFDRPWRDVRTREIEPTLEELQRQWAHGSRLHSVRELDWKIESGDR